jgi:hypothetical protein
MIGTKNIKKNGKAHGIHHKILGLTLITPKIQRIFHCKELVMLHGWHGSHKSELGVIVDPSGFNSHGAYRGYMA